MQGHIPCVNSLAILFHIFLTEPSVMMERSVLKTVLISEPENYLFILCPF